MENIAKRKRIPITIELTPEQIKEAYRKLLEAEHEDWFYAPEVVEELLHRRAQAHKELGEGKTISWEALKNDLGI